MSVLRLCMERRRSYSLSMNPPNDHINHKPHLSLVFFRKVVLLLALLLLAGNIGYRLGIRQIKLGGVLQKQAVVNTTPPPTRDVDFSLFWDVWGRLEQKYI